MGKINVLSFAVANLIAAGEVVDRPASVIKELMENAIDAGATRVTVEIQNGGITFMRVTDNGCGMSPEDLPVAIRRHATSKIRDASDLDGIMTLGFRGEALAAIASVSDIRIISKTAEAPFGAVLEAHGGERITVTEQGCSTGTSVIVENLFSNVPARRKFLKKDVTESMAVTANVEKIALSNPGIAFRLVVDGNVRMETAGDGNLKNTVYALFGRDFANRLIEVNADHEGVMVKGYIGRSDNYKANRNSENFFVNGRFVKSKTAAAALEQAYTSYMPPEKFPCCVLNIDINPGRVDVNVHPAKLEVKFSNEKAVFEAVYYTVRAALEGNVTRPNMDLKGGFRRAGALGACAIVPVENERPESLRSRQLVFDLEGKTQPQPQIRMTAEEYHALIKKEKNRSKAPDSPDAWEKTLAPREQRAETAEPPLQQPVPWEILVQEAEARRKQPAPKDSPVQASPATIGSQTRQESPVPPAPQKQKEESIPVEVAAVTQNTPADPPPVQNVPVRDTVATPPAKTPAPREQKSEERPAEPSFSYRLVGDVFHSYVIVELEDKLLIIDQHAAHERILFEQLKANLQESRPCSQMLMLPVEVMMTSAEVEALKQYDNEIGKIGFSLEYARNTVCATAIPDGVGTNAVPDMLQTMAGRLLDNTGSVKLTRDIIFEKALYQTACKAAIKAGREYAPEHIQWLVKKLMEIPDITFCPHGRPVAMELSKRTLDRQFDRMGF